MDISCRFDEFFGKPIVWDVFLCFLRQEFLRVDDPLAKKTIS